MSPVCKYHMFVQARTDLTDEEVAKYQASHTANSNGPTTWPWRDTGEIIHARRRKHAKAFYRALRQVPNLIKIRADRITDEGPHLGANYKPDAVSLRAWRGFPCLCGSIEGVEDEVKHFGWAPNGSTTACGIDFTTSWEVNGKPECDKCLAYAMEKRPEMKQYL